MPSDSSARVEPVLFSSRTPTPAPRSPLPWVIAAVAVVVVAVALFAFSRHKAAPAANVQQEPDPYAAQMTFGNIVMSESTSLSGGKSTFIDGQVRNTGTKTVTAATVQTLFSSDDSNPPQVETTPLTLIRTREPYVDTQPVGVAPIGPGETRDFRLIFEDVSPNWNQQLPHIILIHAKTR